MRQRIAQKFISNGSKKTSLPFKKHGEFLNYIQQLKRNYMFQDGTMFTVSEFKYRQKINPATSVFMKIPMK